MNDARESDYPSDSLPRLRRTRSAGALALLFVGVQQAVLFWQPDHDLRVRETDETGGTVVSAMQAGSAGGARIAGCSMRERQKGAYIKRYLIAVYIEEHWRSHHCAPSMPQLCEAFDSQWQNIDYHLHTLVAEGRLQANQLPVKGQAA